MKYSIVTHYLNTIHVSYTHMLLYNVCYDLINQSKKRATFNYVLKLCMSTIPTDHCILRQMHRYITRKVVCYAFASRLSTIINIHRAYNVLYHFNATTCKLYISNIVYKISQTTIRFLKIFYDIFLLLTYI